MLILLDSESFPIWSQGVPMSQDQNLGAPLIRVDFDLGFRCSSIWVSTNLRLAWIYWFGGSCPWYPRTLTWSIILRSGCTSSPLLWKWELNGFNWYLYSFGRIISRIKGFCDTLIISKSLLGISTFMTNSFRHWRSQIHYNFSFMTNLW